LFVIVLTALVFRVDYVIPHESRCVPLIERLGLNNFYEGEKIINITTVSPNNDCVLALLSG